MNKQEFLEAQREADKEEQENTRRLILVALGLIFGLPTIGFALLVFLGVIISAFK